MKKCVNLCGTHFVPTGYADGVPIYGSGQSTVNYQLSLN